MVALLRATLVIARRDFVAVVFSRNFAMFLLAPLIMVGFGVVGAGAGQAAHDADRPVIGLAMTASDAAAMQAARDALGDRMAGPIPEFTVIRAVARGESLDTSALLKAGRGQLAAVVSGTLQAPRITTTPARARVWAGMIGTIAARAASPSASPFPTVATVLVATSAADQSEERRGTGIAGLTLVFFFTILLAGMVLSSLVEEKGNKIIEILAAAIPLEALFLGKLFAMLAAALMGIAVWSAVIGGLVLAGGKALPLLAAPAVGWPLFAGLVTVYFAMSYLLIGSVYLAIGSLAATVRDVQTMAMPATMLQVGLFYASVYALHQPGSAVEWVATLFPLTSPYAMVARAAIDPALWPHLVAIAWQAGFTLIFVSWGARLFRAKVMKSGPSGGRTWGLRKLLGARAG